MGRILFITFFLAACSGSPSVPGDVLPPTKMQQVLYDVIRADEVVDFMQMTDSTYRLFSRRTALYDTVFQLHTVTKEKFRKSLQYYQGHPDLMKEMLEEMQKELADTSAARPGR